MLEGSCRLVCVRVQMLLRLDRCAVWCKSKTLSLSLCRWALWVSQRTSREMSRSLRSGTAAGRRFMWFRYSSGSNHLNLNKEFISHHQLCSSVVPQAPSVEVKMAWLNELRRILTHQQKLLRGLWKVWVWVTQKEASLNNQSCRLQRGGLKKWKVPQTYEENLKKVVQLYRCSFLLKKMSASRNKKIHISR